MNKTDWFEPISFELRIDRLYFISSSVTELSSWFVLVHSLTTFIRVWDGILPHFIDRLRIKIIMEQRTIEVVIHVITLSLSEKSCWSLKLQPINTDPSCRTSTNHDTERNLNEVCNGTKRKWSPSKSHSSCISSNPLWTLPFISSSLITWWTFRDTMILVF